MTEDGNSKKTGEKNTAEVFDTIIINNTTNIS